MALPLELTLSKIAKDRKSLMQVLALHSATEIKARVQGKGKLASGKKMKGYSTSYAKTRKKAGRQVNHVSLTFSGMMMNDLKPIEVKVNKAIVGFSSANEQTKADKMTRIKGIWLVLTKKNERELKEIADRRIAKIVSSTRKIHIIKTK